jgi:hypothetical protein
MPFSFLWMYRLRARVFARRTTTDSIMVPEAKSA